VAQNLDRIGQLWVDFEDYFGIKNGAPVPFMIRAEYEAPDYKEDIIESPENLQECIANDTVRGATGPGDYPSIVTRWTVQGLGAIDKNMQVLRVELGGGQLSALVFKETLTGEVTNNVAPTTTGADLDGTPATGFLAAHIGGIIIVEDAVGNKHARILTAVSVNNPVGYDRIAWTPALPSAPAVGSDIFAARTIYPIVTSEMPSLQFVHKGQSDDDILEHLGCCGTFDLDLDPSAKPPQGKITHKFKYASHFFGTPAALSWTAEDNGGAINLSGGMEILVCAYAAGARSTTRTAVAGSSVKFTAGYKLQPALNGNFPNNIGGWVVDKDATLYTLSLRLPWLKAAYIGWVAGLNYHLLVSWGSTAAGMGVLYIPKAIYKGVKRVKVNRQWYIEAVFQAQHPTDLNSSPVNAVEAAPLVLGFVG
jgi:hypothetical protein